MLPLEQSWNDRGVGTNHIWWPAIITSIFLSIAGIWLEKAGLLAAAGIVCIPFTYYMSAGFRAPAIILPLFQIGSAYAIQRKMNVFGPVPGWTSDHRSAAACLDGPDTIA